MEKKGSYAFLGIEMLFFAFYYYVQLPIRTIPRYVVYIRSFQKSMSRLSPASTERNVQKTLSS